LNDSQTVRTGTFHAAVAVLLAAIVGWSLTATTLGAQKETKSPLLNKKPEIMKMLRERELTAAQDEVFTEYFNDYFLKLFTEKTPAMHDNLPKFRSQLKIYFTTGKSGAAHARLNELTLKKMKSILGGADYDAAQKINAMIIIGDLNETEFDAGAAAKPLPASFPVLLVAAQNPKVNDALKATALVGLERFAAANAIPADKKVDLTKNLLDLLNQQSPPGARDAAAHDWMRRSAAQILASMGNSGPDNSVVKAFVAIVSDSKARTTLRCELAQYLGQFKYPAGSKTDFTALASAEGRLVVDVCQQELERAKYSNRGVSRRLVMYAIDSVLMGLGREPAGGKAGTGMLAAAASPHKDFVESVKAKLVAVNKWLDDTELTEDQIATDLPGKLTDLQTALASVKKEELMAADSKDKVPEAGKK